MVMAAVLTAALMHALWNSLVKSAGDKFMTSARVCLWCGIIALGVAAATPWPAAAAWPFVVASALIHIVYFLLVGRLYRTADLSVAYPLMRGFAPLVATGIAAATLGEWPHPLALVGVAALVIGVLAMGASGLANGRIDRTTVAVALINSVVIAVYSVVDGQGARVSGPGMAHAFAYNAWADALTALLVCAAADRVARPGGVVRVCERAGARGGGRLRGLRRICAGGVGDDAGRDRRGGGFARKLGAVRGGDRRAGAGGAVQAGAGGGDGADIGGRCGAEVCLSGARAAS